MSPPTTPRGPRMNVYVPLETQRDIAMAAEELGISKSELVRIACVDLIDRLHVERRISAGPSAPDDLAELKKYWKRRMDALIDEALTQAAIVKGDWK